MNCDCVEKLDERLKEKNLHIVGGSFVMSSFEFRVTIATDWLDKKAAKRGEKPPPMMASHCPFCGKEIAEFRSEGRG
jgi:hypothetical protein